LLGSYLENTAIFPDSLNEYPTLPDVEAEGFFRIDVLSRLTSMNANEHPDMIGSAHDHRIDILPLQKVAVVVVDWPPASAFVAAGILSPGEVAVGQGDHLPLLG
jgi:hypothetical protein